MARWREESGISDLNLYDYFGFEPFFQLAWAECGPFPHFEHKVIEENEKFVISIDSRGITTRNRRDGESMPEWLAHPVRGPDDWERYKAERLQPRLEERLKGLDDFVEKIQPEVTPVQVGNFPWGVFGTARDIGGAEELLIGFYTEPAMVRDIMETLVGLWLAINEKIAEAVQIDHIHIWEDMSGRQGSLISMEMVEDFMMPQYDRIADFARRHDVPLISVDSDGLVDELVPCMMKHGVNVFFPFEVQAGNDIEEYRKLYPELGIIGGLDKRVLGKDKAALNAELDRAERMLAGGGYIPGFDHLIPPDASWENFKYFVEALKKIIGL